MASQSLFIAPFITPKLPTEEEDIPVVVVPVPVPVPVATPLVLYKTVVIPVVEAAAGAPTIQPSLFGPRETYSDLDLRDPFISPYSRDVVPAKDMMAVKNSVRNLVLTNFYETPFDPFRGSDVRGLLFENANAYTAMTIEKEIRRVLIQYEPRVNVSSIDVIDQSDVNAYEVTINFNIIVLNKESSVNFFLERLR